MEKREFKRFVVGLQVAAEKENKESALGLMKDFSRDGLRIVFDKFDFELNSPLDLKIQRPEANFYIFASAEPLWKRAVENKCEVGFKIKEIPPDIKADLLEYGYFKWLKENVYSGRQDSC